MTLQMALGNLDQLSVEQVVLSGIQLIFDDGEESPFSNEHPNQDVIRLNTLQSIKSIEMCYINDINNEGRTGFYTSISLYDENYKVIASSAGLPIDHYCEEDVFKPTQCQTEQIPWGL